MVPDVLGAAGYGDYVSWWKLLPPLLVFLLWTRLITWVDKDSEDAHIPRQVTNLIAVAGLVAALIAFLAMPSFAIAMLVFVFVLLLEMAAYLFVRHQKVGLDDLVKSLKDSFQGKGGKSSKEVTSTEGEVVMVVGGKPIAAPDDESAERGPYEVVQSVLSVPLRKRAERIEVLPTPDGNAVVRYYTDGYPYSLRTLSRAEAAAGVGYLRAVCGMDVNDRRKPQTVKLRLVDPSGKHEALLTVAGSSAGEQMVAEIDVAKRYELRLPDLGMSEDQLQAISESIGRGGGIVLASAPKGQGQTALLYALLRAHDAFVQNIQTVERDPPIDIEGVTQNKLSGGATPADELKLVNWVCSTEPDVLMVPRLDEPKSARELIRLAQAGKRVYVGLRAGSTFDALTQWRRLVGDDQLALSQIDSVIAGRVVRKLCAACKVAYVPDPEAMRKMNLSPERVSKLYQARTSPLRDQRGNEIPCEFCGDLRFKGRVGIYEVLAVNDDVRNALMSGASVEQLKVLFRKQRRRYLQEMALARVESGDTSIQEVLRVLRGESSGKSSGSSS
jgi:general secretion pathway protein E